MFSLMVNDINPIRPGLFLVPGPGGGGGVGGLRRGGVPAPHKSKTVHSIEMKFGRIVEYHKPINLV